MSIILGKSQKHIKVHYVDNDMKTNVTKYETKYQEYLRMELKGEIKNDN